MPEKTTAEQQSEGPGNGGIALSATGKQGTKRKLDQKPLEIKYNAITEFEKGQKSKTEIAKMFDVPKNTLSGWIKKADSIKEGFAKYGPKHRNMRQGNYEELETGLLRWFKQARDQDIAISGPILLEKAKFFAEQLGIEEFKQSIGWLERFKERHGITFKTICGEAKSVDRNSTAMDAWLGHLDTILKKYSPMNIYNADETALFYKLTPEKTLEFKNVNCQGGKRSKERLTVLVCSNMSGDDKLPLLVIGKSANPRCFKNVKTLPVEYKGNSKAWMTGDLFTSWLVKLDKQFHRQNRKVALVIDNCPAHPSVKGLKSIELVFLPPNTTSHTQPMDQGIIRNLKVHYRRQVIKKQLEAIDNRENLILTVLDALRLLRQSWSMVTAQTISNCYRHAGFKSNDQHPTENDSDDEDDNIPIARLVELFEMEKHDVDSFMNIDLEIPVCAESCDSDIINDLMSVRNSAEIDPSEMEGDDEPIPPAPPSISEAMKACETLKTFFESQSNADSDLSMMYSIYKSLTRKDFQKRTAKQTSINDFFR